MNKHQLAKISSLAKIPAPPRRRKFTKAEFRWCREATARTMHALGMDSSALVRLRDACQHPDLLAKLTPEASNLTLFGEWGPREAATVLREVLAYLDGLTPRMRESGTPRLPEGGIRE